jgi:AmpD protein
MSASGKAEPPEGDAHAWQDGWWSAARRIESPNHDARPAGDTVSLAVIHSISLPPGE